MSNESPSFVDPQILLWNPNLLWARYLEIVIQWREDQSSKDKIRLVYTSPEELGKAMLAIHNDSSDDEGLKLRWEMLFAFGYGASKAFQKWTKEETTKIVGEVGQEVLGKKI